ncbi:unnamed protein product, partial [Symbiodinium microadriaticum]
AWIVFHAMMSHPFHRNSNARLGAPAPRRPGLQLRLSPGWQILDVEDAFASLRDFHDVESIRCCACSRAFDGAPESAERAWARGLGGVCYRGEEGPDLGTGGLPEMEALRPERESILIPKSITGDNPGPIASFSYGCDDKRFYQ